MSIEVHDEEARSVDAGVVIEPGCKRQGHAGNGGTWNGELHARADEKLLGVEVVTSVRLERPLSVTLHGKGDGQDQSHSRDHSNLHESTS